MLLILGAISLIAYLFYKWATKYYTYFEDRNVPYAKPIFLLGNIGKFMIGLYTAREFSDSLYNATTKKICGIFNFREPAVVLRDPDIIKQLTIKDFEYFEDKKSFVPDTDDLIGKSLIMLKGAKWHDMRSTISPAFTGSKMRTMFDLILDNIVDMTAYLKEQNCLEYNLKSLFSKLSMDMVANSSFGIKINSFEDEKNKFHVTATEFLNFSSPIFMFRMALFNILPIIARLFNVSLFAAEVKKFLKDMVISNIEVREKKGIFRPDIINLIMNVRKGIDQQSTEDSKIADSFATVEESNVGKKKITRQWSDDELIAQCFIFLFAGLESVSNNLSFIAYELAINFDVQQRLYEEIVQTESTCNGKKLTYEQLQKMKYLDMVISEALRKWCPIALTDRLCTKDYEYDDGETKFKITKGMSVVVPIISLHFDESYYPNPTVFDPERFNDENKKNIRPGTYLPFGIGPRSCIGSRLALMEAKAVLYHLLLNFKLVPYGKTQVPLKLAKTPMGMHTENGIYLKFERRTV